MDPLSKANESNGSIKTTIMVEKQEKVNRKENRYSDEEEKEESKVERYNNKRNRAERVEPHTEPQNPRVPKRGEHSGKNDLEAYLHNGRLICLYELGCKKTNCNDLHSISICESTKECQNDCEKIHFNDLIVSLMKIKNIDKEILLTQQPKDFPSKYDLLDFRRKIDLLSQKIIDYKRSVRSIKENDGWDEHDKVENRTKEQIQTMKEKIEQIELTTENYLRSILKVFMDFFRDQKQGIGNLIDSLQLEAHCSQELLPIYCKKIDIMDFLESKNESFMVLSGETGSGKSTQLPLYIVQHLNSNVDLGEAAVIEPRKVSALALANRVCDELGINTGDEVGFEVGSKESDKSISSSTKLVFMTDNQFIQKLMRDENLSRYSIIVIDEAHERTISSDIILSVLRHRYMEKKLRKDLKVIVASASIDIHKFSKYLDDAQRTQYQRSTVPNNHQI